ncbi:unnamed protein product, partial [Prorocentrum cordatum]
MPASTRRVARWRQERPPKESDLNTLLQQVVQKSESAALKAAVSQELSKLLAKGPETTAPGGEAEAVRRANGAWRDADTKHSQAVAAVVRLQDSLAIAIDKEVQAAQVLAQAEKAKRAAVEALARVEGIMSSSVTAKDASPVVEGTPSFRISWNEALFQGLDDLECEDEEREQLRLVHTQLQELQATLSAKEADIQAMLEKAAVVRKEVEERNKKKRKTGMGEGQAAPGGGEPTAPPAPAAGSGATAEAPPADADHAAAQAEAAEQARTDDIEKEAARLSAAKFAAQREALAAQKAALGKSMGKGKGNGDGSSKGTVVPGGEAADGASTRRQQRAPEADPWAWLSPRALSALAAPGRRADRAMRAGAASAAEAAREAARGSPGAAEAARGSPSAAEARPAAAPSTGAVGALGRSAAATSATPAAWPPKDGAALRLVVREHHAFGMAHRLPRRDSAWDFLTGIEDDIVVRSAAYRGMLQGKTPAPRPGPLSPRGDARRAPLEQPMWMTVDGHLRAQLRLTGFHGTPVLVVVLLFLRPSEAGRVRTCDRFFQRVGGHEKVWQGLRCRDYIRDACSTKRCMWQVLGGSLDGAGKCVYHLRESNAEAFRDTCKQITRIPGRSKEELMESRAQPSRALRTRGEGLASLGRVQFFFVG